jgi:hypothetical protein
LWDTPTNALRAIIKFGDAYSLDEIFETAVIMSDAYNKIAQLIKPLSNDSGTVTNDTKLERDYVGKFRTRFYKHAYLFYGRSDGSFTKYTCNPPSEDEIDKMVMDTGDADSPSLEKAVSNTPNTDDVCVGADNDITTQPSSGNEVKKQIQTAIALPYVHPEKEEHKPQLSTVPSIRGSTIQLRWVRNRIKERTIPSIQPRTRKQTT